ncbi:N-acetyltransferase [Candidatus Pacearchaeota archaeon]|nr:N-acetyltransferase [Candidatus Pacearchaeota archaeon]
MIRKANLKDVRKIHKIVNYFAERGDMLPRSLNSVYENIRDFFIFEQDGRIIGCVALKPSWQDLAEIRSLAVLKRFQKKGIGKELVQACIDDAKLFGFKKVFALTYVPKYFQKFGFRVVDKKKFPHRIWTECINCPKFPKCNEILLVKNLY